MDTSNLKFGEREEVQIWAENLDHATMCKILAPQFDHPGPYTAPQPTDWRSYYTDEELRGFVVDHVMLAANVAA